MILGRVVVLNNEKYAGFVSCSSPITVGRGQQHQIRLKSTRESESNANSEETMARLSPTPDGLLTVTRLAQGQALVFVGERQVCEQDTAKPGEIIRISRSTFRWEPQGWKKQRYTTTDAKILEPMKRRMKADFEAIRSHLAQHYVCWYICYKNWVKAGRTLAPQTDLKGVPMDKIFEDETEYCRELSSFSDDELVALSNLVYSTFSPVRQHFERFPAQIIPIAGHLILEKLKRTKTLQR